jgi:hypothetical protein
MVGETCGCTTPVPLRVAVWGEPVAASATLRDAVRLPTVCGVNVTAIVQLVPAGKVALQLFVWLKSELAVPVTLMPLIDNAALPGLDNVIVWSALAVPRF